MLTVDPRTLAGGDPLAERLGAEPGRLMRELAAAPALPLPVIVSDGVPASLHSITIQGTRFPIRIIDRLHAFPGMTTNPLFITSTASLADGGQEAAQRRTLCSGSRATTSGPKGPPATLVKALEAPGLDISYVTLDRRVPQGPADPARDADVLVRADGRARRRADRARRARALPPGAAAVAADRLGARAADGPLAGSEILSLFLELAAILLASAVVGVGVAAAVAAPIVEHVDLLPDFAPSSVVVIPWNVAALPRPRAPRGRGDRSRGHLACSRAGPTSARLCASPEPLVICRGLSKVYVTPTGSLEALHDVDAAFEVGEMTAVVGASGSGKSTLLRAIAGLDRPSRGELRVAGRELDGAPGPRCATTAADVVTYVAQRAAANFVPHLTLAEQSENSARRVARALPRLRDRAPARLAPGRALGRRAGARRVRARARARHADRRLRRADGRARSRLGPPAARGDPDARRRRHRVRPRDPRPRRRRDRRPRAPARPRARGHRRAARGEAAPHEARRSKRSRSSRSALRPRATGAAARRSRRSARRASSSGAARSAPCSAARAPASRRC